MHNRRNMHAHVLRTCRKNVSSGTFFTCSSFTNDLFKNKLILIGMFFVLNKWCYFMCITLPKLYNLIFYQSNAITCPLY